MVTITHNTRQKFAAVTYAKKTKQTNKNKNKNKKQTNKQTKQNKNKIKNRGWVPWNPSGHFVLRNSNKV